jgi:hypothetical protein
MQTKKCKICGNDFEKKSNSHLFCDKCKTKTCKYCGKEFVFEARRKPLFCSSECYLLHRWGAKKCKNCGIDSKTIFCSKKCRKNFWNKNDYPLVRKKRIWDRKIEIIKILGGKCIICGVTDIRVLEINHKDRSQKKIPPKRQYTWQRRLKEWSDNFDNLELLCANCHRIHTWKQMGYGIY